jgi:hypothetical protein
VPAVEIEKLVLEGIRSHQASVGEAEGALASRDLIEQRVHSVTIKPRGIDVRLFAANRPSDDTCIPGTRVATRQRTDDRNHAALDGSKFRRRQGNRSFAFCKKARTEAREPGGPADRYRQGQAMD